MMTWIEYNERFVVPALDRADAILAEQGKSDTYTLADVEAAIKQAARELNLHGQEVQS